MSLVYANMRMSEVVSEHLSLIPVINRFGIRLGVSDDTVMTVCEKNKVDTAFFLTIINTFINEDYFPEKKLQNFHLTQIIDYLKKTNHYYLQNQLPNIERHLHFFIKTSGQNNASLELIGKMFVSFKEKLCHRIEYDETEWFPYMLALNKKNGRKKTVRTKVTTLSDESSIEAIIDDMRNIMIKHLTGMYDDNLCYAVLFAINALGHDIRQHNRIRNRILIPMVDDNSCTLSNREKEVLKLIVSGYTNKEIAAKLFVSMNTILTHRKNITAKLGIKTIPGLTFYAITNKIITGINES